MTERKPAGMDWESWVDIQIRQARERGEFSELAGHGKPIAHLDGEEDELWWVRQLLKRENVEVPLPPTLAVRKARDELLDMLPRVASEAELREVVAELNTRIREVNRVATEGPPSSVMPLDVERIVERWRDARSVS